MAVDQRLEIRAERRDQRKGAHGLQVNARENLVFFGQRCKHEVHPIGVLAA